jgi:hypothetical protein
VNEFDKDGEGRIGSWWHQRSQKGVEYGRVSSALLLHWVLIDEFPRMEE